MNYGKELVIDLHNCACFTMECRFSRAQILDFFVAVCDAIDMERGPVHFWDYLNEEEYYADAPDHLKGTSAIQFIFTSNITIHTLDVLKTVYINVFSCKDFDSSIVRQIALDYFKGYIVQWQEFDRL